MYAQLTWYFFLFHAMTIDFFFLSTFHHKKTKESLHDGKDLRKTVGFGTKMAKKFFMPLNHIGDVCLESMQGRP